MSSFYNSMSKPSFHIFYFSSQLINAIFSPPAISIFSWDARVPYLIWFNSHLMKLRFGNELNLNVATKLGMYSFATALKRGEPFYLGEEGSHSLSRGKRWRNNKQKITYHKFVWYWILEIRYQISLSIVLTNWSLNWAWQFISFAALIAKEAYYMIHKAAKLWWVNSISFRR